VPVAVCDRRLLSSKSIHNWAPPRRGARARSEIFILILMLRGYTPGWHGLALLPSRRLRVHFMLLLAITVRFGCTPAWRGLTLLCDLPSCRLGVTLLPVIALCFGCTPAWRGLTPLMRLQFALGKPTFTTLLLGMQSSSGTHQLI